MQHVERVEGEYVNRGVVPGRKVLVEEDTAPVLILRPHHAAHGAPQIELVRDGDVIRAIDVTCGCGQKVRLRCVYEGPAAGA